MDQEGRVEVISSSLLEKSNLVLNGRETEYLALLLYDECKVVAQASFIHLGKKDLDIIKKKVAVMNAIVKVSCSKLCKMIILLVPVSELS